MLWDASYETGNAAVDKDHKEIFALVEKVLNEAFENRKEKVLESIDFLTSYVVRHFANEDRIQEECNYPDMATHKKQHTDFAAEVGEMRRRIEREGETLDMSLLINKTVVGWLTKHVMGSDKAMADYYKGWKAKK